MSTIVWVVVIALVAAAGLIWFYNRGTGADVDQDGDVDLQDAKLAVTKTIKQANEDINAAVAETKAVAAETKRRAKRVKEEVADVVVAAKEVANQAGDVVAAAKGKSRAGRKPGSKNTTSKKK